MSRTIAPPDCLSVKDIADDLKCSVSTVYNLARTMGLPLRMRRGSKRGKYARYADYIMWKKETF